MAAKGHIGGLQTDTVRHSGAFNSPFSNDAHVDVAKGHKRKGVFELVIEVKIYNQFLVLKVVLRSVLSIEPSSASGECADA